MDGLSSVKDEIVSAADVNRRFSELLRGVREQGKSFTLTSHGTPVALLARLESQERTIVGPWTRNELYDEEEPQQRIQVNF